MTAHSLRRGALALLASTLFACGSPPETTSSDPTPEPFVPEVPDIAFASSIEDAMAGRYKDSFNLMATRDIFVAVKVPATSDVQFLRMQLLQESGVPFSTTWRAFSAVQQSSTVRHPTISEMIRVKPASIEGEHARLYLAIPVAGTNLTRFGKSGTFTVEVSLGAENPQPLAVESFVLEGM